MSQYTDIYKRIWGDEDIKEVNVILGLNDVLTITLEDESEETIQIENKSYNLSLTPRGSEIVNEINSKFKINDILECYLGSVRGDRDYECLVFKSKENKKITGVTGSFADDFFYKEEIIDRSL